MSGNRNVEELKIEENENMENLVESGEMEI